MIAPIVRRATLILLLAAGCAASLPDRATAAELEPARLIRLPVVSAGATAAPRPGTASLVAHQQTVAVPAAASLFSGPTAVTELVAYALANNAEIAAARYHAAALLSRVPQARALEDPLLSATVFLEEIQTAGGPQEAMFSLSQKFPWFGKQRARGEIAFHDAQVAYAQLAHVELEVVQQVKLAFYDLYFIERAIDVYGELEPKLRDVIAVTRARYETDSKRIGLESVYQAEITLHKLQITLAELEQARRKAAARLAKALHLPHGLSLQITPQLQQATLPRQVDVLVAMIEQCQPRLEARRQAIIRDKWSVTLARKDYYPDAKVGFDWRAIGERGLSPVANGQDAYALMVGVNLPVYRAKRDAALREARLATASSTRRYDATWDTLRSEVEQLHALAVEHDRVLQILNRDILRKAQQTFELSVEAFRVDRIGFQQLIDNYENLIRFRVDYDFRRASREQALAQLERAVGCVLADWPPSPNSSPAPRPE